MKPLIIAMAGKMGSGKDTAGKFLIEKHGFHRIAFADNLKTMAMKVFGLTHEQCYDELKKFELFEEPKLLTKTRVQEIIEYAFKVNRIHVTSEQAVKLNDLLFEKHESGVGKVYSPPKLKSPREVLQFLGTEVLRECIQSDYHAQVVYNAIELHKWEKVVITDCRFPNEREAVDNWGGYTMLIERPTKELEGGISGHASENSLGQAEEYNYTVANVGTIEDLYNDVNRKYVAICTSREENDKNTTGA